MEFTEGLRKVFLAGVGAVSYTHLDVYKRQVHVPEDTSHCPHPDSANARSSLRLSLIHIWDMQ